MLKANLVVLKGGRKTIPESNELEQLEMRLLEVEAIAAELRAELRAKRRALIRRLLNGTAHEAAVIVCAVGFFLDEASRLAR